MANSSHRLRACRPMLGCSHERDLGGVPKENWAPTVTGPRIFRRIPLRSARAGMVKVFGFGLSMLFLAIASLATIPAMVAASGPAAWGMIAAGQAIGSIAAVGIAYGWELSGPAVIARADAEGRLREYLESVICKLILYLPITGAAFALAWLLGRDLALFAGIGAISTASIGLTSSWFFVGRARPFALLLCETVPRVAGTVVGIVLMVAGSSALTGVVWQLIGMLAAFIVSFSWVVRPWRLQALRAIRRRRIRAVFWAQRHGLAASITTATYGAAPIAIVTIFAPGVQPVYAVLDKVQRQVNVGLSPLTAVIQGWVPRAPRGGLATRVKQAIAFAALFGVILSVGMFLVAPELIGWLGSGQIHPTPLALALMSAITGMFVIESTVSKACLSALGRLDVAARATLTGLVVGLPLVAVGAVAWGAEGALTGIIAGLTVRLGIEIIVLVRTGSKNPDDLTSSPVQVEES